MNYKWYVVRTYSGHENKVKTLLETELNDNESIKAKVNEILVPTEKVFEVKVQATETVEVTESAL